MMFVILGVIVWETARTLDFEWSLITRKRRFKWPLVCPLRAFAVALSSLTRFDKIQSASHPLLLSDVQPADIDIRAAFFFLCRYCILLAIIGLCVCMLQALLYSNSLPTLGLCHSALQHPYVVSKLPVATTHISQHGVQIDCKVSVSYGQTMTTV